MGTVKTKINLHIDIQTGGHADRKVYNAGRSGIITQNVKERIRGSNKEIVSFGEMRLRKEMTNCASSFFQSP